MDILLVVPPKGVRDRLRVAFGSYASLRAETYERGLVLAEQYPVHCIVLWSDEGADPAALEVYRGLRARALSTPIVVITPRFLPAGREAMDYFRPRAYALDSATDEIVAEALNSHVRRRRLASPNGVPAVVVTGKPRSGGTSSSGH